MKTYRLILPLLLILLFMVASVSAQDTPETPPPPVVDADGPPVDEPPPDPAPWMDELGAGLTAFWKSAAVLMGFAVFLVTQVIKFVLPDRVIETKTIYIIVFGVGTAIYFFAQVIGQDLGLGKAIDLLTPIANTLLAILGMLTIPSISYAIGQKLQNPLMGGRQGGEWFSFAEPTPNLLPVNYERNPGDYVQSDSLPR